MRDKRVKWLLMNEKWYMNFYFPQLTFVLNRYYILFKKKKNCILCKRSRGNSFDGIYIVIIGQLPCFDGYGNCEKVFLRSFQFVKRTVQT